MIGALLALFVGLAAAWRWTALGDWLDFEALSGAAETLERWPATPLVVPGVYVVAGLLAVPVTALIAITVLVFGPWLGLAYALAGSLLSAATAYGLGRFLGRDAVRRLAGARLNRLSARLGRRGLLAVVAVRLIPIAPFTVVNIVAGATHIRLRDFMLGTLLGMAPGIIATVPLIDRISAAIRDPGAGTFVVLAGIVVLLLAAGIGLRRWLRRQEGEQSVDEDTRHGGRQGAGQRNP